MTIRRYRLNFVPIPSREECLKLEGFEDKNTKINNNHPE